MFLADMHQPFYAALPVDEIIGIKERPRGQKKRAGT